MSSALDFRPLVDISPYVPPAGWSVGAGIPKIQGLSGTGLLRAAAGGGGRVMLMADIPAGASTTQYKFRWQTGFSQGGSDYSGVTFLNAVGTGFGVANQGANLKMFTVTTYSIGGEIWSSAIPAAVAGDWFNVVFDINVSTPASSSLKIFQESVSTTVPKTTRTAAHTSGMKMGAICNWGNTNAEGLQQIIADYGNPIIDSVDPTPTIGDTINITTSGLGTLTSVTVGGVAVSSLSAPAGDGTGILTSWVVGNVGIPLGTQFVVVTDGTNTSGATDKTIIVGAPSGKQFVQLLTVNTSAGYLGAVIAGLAIGDQIESSTATALGLNPATEFNFIDDDSGFYSDYISTQTILVRKASTGIVESHTITTGGGSDTTPNTFTFGSVTGVALNAMTPAPSTATLAGMTSGVDVSAVPSGGLRYRVSSDGITFGSWLTTTSNVRNGYVIDAELQASGLHSTLVTGTLTVGGVAGTLSVTTAASSDVPDPLVYAPQLNAELLTTYTSTTETVTGMDVGESSAFTVANGTYSKNGGSFISTPGTMEPDDTFALRGVSDQYFGRSKDVTLTATNGSVVSTYRITNKLDPLLPTGGGSTVVGQFLTGYTL